MSDLVSMARAASYDDRLADGMLYRKLADEIERLQQALDSLSARQAAHDAEWCEGRDLPRLVAQAQDVSRALSAAGIMACPLTEGVRRLVDQRDKARATADRWKADYRTVNAALAEAQAAKYPGCKVLSLGDQCPCKLCGLERERDEAVRLGQLHWEDWDQAERELAALRTQRCGNCADSVIHNLMTKLYGCRSKTSACAGPKNEWPADHGCPHWRAKETKYDQAVEATGRMLRAEQKCAEAAAEIERLREAYEREKRERERNWTERNEARAERDEARALLRDIEWSSMDRNGHACCPCCGRVDTQGHNSVCRLDAALGKGGAR